MKWPARSVYYLVSGLGDIRLSDYNEIWKINVGSQYFIFYLRINTDFKRIMTFDFFAFLKLNLNTRVDLFVYIIKRVDNVLPLSLTTNIALFFSVYEKLCFDFTCIFNILVYFNFSWKCPADLWYASDLSFVLSYPTSTFCLHRYAKTTFITFPVISKKGFRNSAVFFFFNRALFDNFLNHLCSKNYHS